MKHIYLDHAGTTPMHPEVIAEMTAVMQDNYGNPSSIHGVGREAHRKLEGVRQVVAQSIGARPHEIIFTSGGTEGDNTAIVETALKMKTSGRHIITTAVEHLAVLQPMRYLQDLGFDVTYLPVDATGKISVSELASALREDTILVSVMAGNNENGQLMPIRQIGELLKEHTALFHTDAVQVYGSQQINVEDWGVDLLSVSAHKINGPKGVGCLNKRDGVPFEPLIRGGEQEEKRRAGTENLPGIAGMGKAVELLTSEHKAEVEQRNNRFQEMLLQQLKDQGIAYQVNGALQGKLSHILNIWIKGIPNDLLLMHLDLNGIAISTGSACTAGTVDPSHVLEAMYGKESPSIRESIRISFGYGNTEEEIGRFTQVLIQSIERLKS